MDDCVHTNRYSSMLFNCNTIYMNDKREKKLDPKYKYLYEDIEDKFQGFFGTKVKLDQGKRKGKIIIEYHNNEDLERMLNLIKEN